MFGLTQVRAYKTIMTGPKHLPRHTEGDVRLFRTIIWGALFYIAFSFAEFLILDTLLLRDEFSDPWYLVVVPVAALLLVCWWTTDLVPRFARWSILILAAIFAVPLIILLIFLLTREPLLGLAVVTPFLVYLSAVGREASLQLLAIRNAEKSEDDDEHNVA